MSFELSLGTAGSSTVVRMAGEDHDVETVRSVLDRAVRQVTRRLVIDVHDSDLLPSGAVRCLAVAGQQVPQSAEVVVEGASPALMSQLRLAGLDRSMTIVHREPNALATA
ncbi:hypothetical protein HY68_34740 [Streptomyces sp. AcH 505]|uniref:STAS domain-containing protein n=1 Tax=unclassified Streptomyces TaxID=2593676 RepID=UPI000591886A|nr:STAS domain-containing protein [Streptomyces sp. NBC_00370]KIF66968.1 hypothetical protein HY68_34740 [Streptomyces sp. AcH 505]